MSADLTLHSLDASLGGLVSADTLEGMPGGSTAQLMLECRRLTRLLDAHGVPLVTSYHVVRMLAVVVLSGPLYGRLRGQSAKRT